MLFLFLFIVPSFSYHLSLLSPFFALSLTQIQRCFCTSIDRKCVCVMTGTLMQLSFGMKWKKKLWVKASIWRTKLERIEVKRCNSTVVIENTESFLNVWQWLSLMFAEKTVSRIDSQTQDMLFNILKSFLRTRIKRVHLCQGFTAPKMVKCLKMFNLYLHIVM